ncbi:MAG TPA: TetR/AcrR family transcriptional regulator [Leifsonia sp.]|jgi:TetR/AcrR family transcriptional regulator
MVRLDHERIRDAERTRADILAVATREFADRGYAGARVDEIARRMSTTKRMIYYYFGGKEQLYVSVLEAAYAEMRGYEQEIDVSALEPLDAIREIAERTFDHHTSRQDFVRLVAIENIHRATFLREVGAPETLALPALELIDTVLRRGRASGVFRDDVDATDVHMAISSFCVFPVANRHTFGYLFGRDLLNQSRAGHYRQMLGDMIVALLTPAAA